MDSPGKESNRNHDDNVVEDEEIEEDTASDDEDYIEGHDETSDVFSEVKEKKNNLFYIKFFHNFINLFVPLSNRQQ